MVWTGSARASDAEVRWHDEWPRFRAWQYATTGVLLGGSVATRYLAPDPDPTWTGGILFDDFVADELSLRNEPTRWALALATDAILYAGVSYRAVDSTLVPGLAHDDWEVAQQMVLLDLQAYGIIMAALWGSQAFVGRDRPLNARCDDPAVRAHELICNPDDEHRYRSFISGHVAIAVATAGLTCLHHANLPLYGAPWDGVACGTMIGLSIASTVGRTITLNHWATDSLLGALLGLGAGYILPAALHYGFDGSGPGTQSAALGQSQSPAPALPPLTVGGSF